jgi:hypothetical protein
VEDLVVDGVAHLRPPAFLGEAGELGFEITRAVTVQDASVGWVDL